MPPGSHRRQQCSYREGRTRCRRDGSGSPPLCPPHQIEVAEESRRAERSEAPGASIGELFADFISGRPISKEKIASTIKDVAWGLGGVLGADPSLFEEEDPYHDDTGEFQHERDNRSRAPRDRVYGIPAVDELAEKRRAIRAAKIELGFAESEPVTLDQLKQRHRELAARHHPDRGGSLDKMQRINQAVDLLKKSL